MHVQQLLHDQETGLLSVHTNNSGNLILKILDVQGRMAKTIIEKVEQGCSELALNIGDLAEGIYVLNAFFGDSFVKAFRIKR